MVDDESLILQNNAVNAEVTLKQDDSKFRINYDYNYTAGNEDCSYLMKCMILPDGRMIDVPWDNIKYIEYKISISEYADYCNDMYIKNHAKVPDDEDCMEVVEFSINDTKSCDSSMYQ